MKYFQSLFALLYLLLLAHAIQAHAAVGSVRKRPPHIVLFISDDLSFAKIPSC